MERLSYTLINKKNNLKDYEDLFDVEGLLFIGVYSRKITHPFNVKGFDFYVDNGLLVKNYTGYKFHQGQFKI